jgi:hypothetical protein
MERAHARAVLDAQNAMYSGGGDSAVRALLTEDIEWHIPGDNAIAGDDRGIDEVVRYFQVRRALASNTLRLYPGDMLIGDSHLAVLTDGAAGLGEVEHRWSTVGLYRLRGELICACWLLALNQPVFDRAWAPRAS